MSVEIHTIETVKCPYCDSEAVVKYGKYKDIPRYWCKSTLVTTRRGLSQLPA